MNDRMASLRKRVLGAMEAKMDRAVLEDRRGLLVIEYRVGYTIIDYLAESGGPWIPWPDGTSSMRNCSCTSIPRTQGGLGFALCSKHRAMLKRLFGTAGVGVKLRPVRRRQRKPVDLYFSGKVVRGGLPTLGKRR